MDTSEDESVTPHKKSEAKCKLIKDPEMLSDGKIVTYKAWKIKMKDKLEQDHQEYRTEKEKVSFIFSRITDKASDILLPYIQPGPLRIVTARTAFEILSACFQDRQHKSKARVAFRKLYLHEGGDYHHFHTEFISLALVSGISLDSYKEELVEQLPESIRILFLDLEQDDEVDFDKYQKRIS